MRLFIKIFVAFFKHVQNSKYNFLNFFVHFWSALLNVYSFGIPAAEFNYPEKELTLNLWNIYAIMFWHKFRFISSVKTLLCTDEIYIIFWSQIQIKMKIKFLHKLDAYTLFVLYIYLKIFNYDEKIVNC